MSDAPPAGSRVADYDYDLPPELIARYPTERRDQSRLLAVGPGQDQTRHLRFAEVEAWFGPNDVLVLNESRVRPVRFSGRKPTGAAAEVLLIKPLDDGSWEALVRPGSKLKPGRSVEVADDLTIDVLGPAPGGGRRVALRTSLDQEAAIDRYGSVPLPPYLARDAEPIDRERYQTVYARVDGSVAAPTAGLHFTPELLDRIRARGVTIAPLVLHVGIGTFRPVEAEVPSAHEMHREEYDVPVPTAEAIMEARHRGGRVWAVGTTVVRVLESVSDPDGRVRPGPGATDLFIHPPQPVTSIDRLITNFHLPRSTLLMLVASMVGYSRIRDVYAEAIREGYRFYSYGDAMVILR